MSSEPQNPGTYVLKTVRAVTEEWMKSHSPEQLRQETLNRLNANADRIVMYLLGFKTNSYGNFELDHRDGHAGDSSAGDYLRKHQQETIDKWLAEVPLPTLKPQEKKNITQDARYLFENSFNERYRQRVIDAGKKAADQAFEAFSVEGAIRRYEQALKLINPEETI